MTLRPRIPPLAFGNARAIEFDDPEKMAEGLAPTSRATLKYRSLDPELPFLCRSSMMKTRDARVVASASSSVEVDAAAPSAIGVLLLPLHGTTIVQYGGRTLEWGVSAGPVFLPADRCIARASVRSAIGIDIDPIVMERLLRTMLGNADDGTISKAIDYATPRLLPHRSGKAMDIAHYIMRHIASFDALGGDPVLIERSGLDDTILRSAILYLCPDLFVPRRGELEHKQGSVHLVCDYIDANLNARITMTDLERVSGLSARRLQYAFRSAFDKTPMQWVIERRLDAVRKKILSAQDGMTVTRIAGEYFSNLGEFASLYKARFGEMPSETLKAVFARRFR